MSTSMDILNMLRNDHTFAQRLNYFKYKFSKKGEALNYDPVTISVVATTKCTLSCDMCPTHSTMVPRDYPYLQRNAKDIDFEMFKEIIDKFDKALEVHIIGSGEPLLNKDFFRMVDYAATKRMKVKTFSNGTTIERNIGRILDSKLDGITISLNGHSPGEFRRMTGMDERIFGQICATTKMLIEMKNRRGSKIKVKASFIIDRYNYKFIPEMISLSLKLGIDHIFFCNFLPSPYDGLRAHERVMMAEDKVIDELNSIFKSYPFSIRRKITPPTLVDEKMDRNQCATHFSQVRFDGDGNISSCSMMLLDMSGNGNYRDEDLWNNDFFRRMRRAFLSKGDERLPAPCRVCPDNKGRRIA